MTWQPIDTAPKDGTLILAVWGTKNTNNSWGLTHWCQNGRGWISEDDREYGVPDYWMPLPKPPKEQE